MELGMESKTGICDECHTKEGDSSQKKVYHCELCDKWFCETHSRPKFPYFIDWETVLTVQGDSEIKALYYTEYQREGGHPDFVYWRRTFEARDMEKKELDRLVKLALDSMYTERAMEAAARRRFAERQAGSLGEELSAVLRELNKAHRTQIEKPTEGKYWWQQGSPKEVYSNKEYGEKLKNAKTLYEAEQIIDDYYARHRQKKVEAEEQIAEPKKKKHWWQ